MLTRDQKEKIVEELSSQFKRQKIVVFSDFRGVSVAKTRELRRQLGKNGAWYKIAKKTLLNRALQNADIHLDTKKLEGEIAVTFIYKEDMEPVKNLVKFGKENETFQNRAGLMGARVIDISEVMALAKLPTRDILLAQLLYAMQGTLRGFVNVLQGNIRNFVVVLDKIRNSKSEARN